MKLFTTELSKRVVPVAALALAVGSGCSSSSSGSLTGPPSGNGGTPDSGGMDVGTPPSTGSDSGTPPSGDSGVGGGDTGGGTGPDGGSTGTTCTMANATCVSNNQACNVGNVYDLYDNQWGCGGGQCGPESAYGCLNGNGSTDFVINSNQPAGNTAVLTYPAMQLNLNNNPALSSLKSVMSSFTVATPTGANNDWEVAYDLWFNANNANEFMVWVFNSGQTPAGDKVATSVSLGGKSYDVWWAPNGGTDGTVSFVLTTNVTSGTFDLLQLFNYAAQNGWLPPTSVATQFDFGVEVCSTNGQNATWTVTNYSMTVM